MGMTEILPASFRYYNSCGRKTSMEKLGQPENHINALGVHYANCVDLNYPSAPGSHWCNQTLGAKHLRIMSHPSPS